MKNQQLNLVEFIGVLLFLLLPNTVISQYCDSLTPTMNVDLSASPNVSWTSPSIARNGNCCGTTNPDQCLEFIITLHQDAIAVNFTIASGAVPPGALFYQIDCGPVTPVGSPICLNGPGPHHLTFCKPGNNENTFSITSYSEPVIGPDTTLSAGCQGFIYAQYYNEASISWTSIAPGNAGDYDSYLSCTSGCDTTFVSAPNSGAPAFVDYLVCGMDVGGCDPSPICDTIRVNFVSPHTVDVSPALSEICAGDPPVLLTANVSGGTGPFTYLWSNGATTSSILETGGIHSVDVTDQGGCLTITNLAEVIENPLPIVNAGPDQSVCDGVSITLNGSGAVSYAWDNGVVDGVSFVQAVGTTTYTVTGTDANGCSNTDQVDVIVNPLPLVDAGANQTVCDGESVTLSGSGAINYVWDNGITDGVSFTPALGTTTYSVVGTDANGCSNSDQVDVTVNPLPVVDAGADQTVCEGISITLNGSGAVSYAWDNGVIDGVSFVQAAGTITYTVVGTNANGCENSDQVDVTVNALPLVDAGPDQAVCEGVSVTLNGSGAASYDWNNGVVDGVSFVQAVGTITYTVIGTDGNGCESSDQVDVTVNPLPDVDAGPNQSVCEATPITLSSTGTSNLTWNNGVTNNIPFYQAVGTVVYTVQDSLSTGCVASDDVSVTVHPNPAVRARDEEICSGQGVTLLGEGALTYSWTGGVIDGVEFYPTSTASYEVTGINEFGCSASFEATVIVHESPVADFNILDLTLTTVNSGTGFENLSSGAVSYEWDFGDGSWPSNEFEPYHEFPTDEAGSYEITLTVTSAEGCVDDRVKYVYVTQDYTIYVPNSFTPDGNGVNEIFKPVLEGFDENDYTLYIFNRWGDLVFQSHDMEVGWDGKYSQYDIGVQDGVFTWKIEAGIANSSDSKIFVGHVSILK